MFIIMNKEIIIARKLKIFSVDKERNEKVAGNPPTNRGILNIDKEIIIICLHQSGKH